MKTCSKCENLKSFENFYKGKLYKDGYRNICKQCVKQYEEENKESRKEYLKNYKEVNKENLKLKNKKYREYNSDKIIQWKEINKDCFKQYRKDNKVKISNYLKKRLDNEPVFRFKNNVRRLILHSFKRGRRNFKKLDRTEVILGCKIEEFINHISKKFTEGMTLENHGEWHIDHIIPLATAKTKEDVIILNHYTNLQPLWALDNLSKGSKILN
jgi:hypothetical protein